MGVLTTSSIDVGSSSKITINEPYSVKFQFRNNECFYINQILEESVKRTVVSDEPHSEVEPEVTVVFNQKLDTVLSKRVLMVDTNNVQLRCRRPSTDKTKAMLLVNNVMREL